MHGARADPPRQRRGAQRRRVLGIRADPGRQRRLLVLAGVAALDCGQAADNVSGPYDIRNYERHVYAVVTNKTPMGPYRGVGRPHGCLTAERIMDEVARKLDMDPAEVRRKNFIREFPYITASELPPRERRLLRARCELGLDNSATRRSARSTRSWPRGHLPRRRHRLQRRAVGPRQSAVPAAQEASIVAAGYDTAEMRVEPDGKVRLGGRPAQPRPGPRDHHGPDRRRPARARPGRGHRGRLRRHRPGALRLRQLDSSRARSTAAARPSSPPRDIREKATTIAAHMLEANPDDLEMQRGGKFAVRGNPAQSISLRRGRQDREPPRGQAAPRRDRAGARLDPAQVLRQRIGALRERRAHRRGRGRHRDRRSSTIGKLRRSSRTAARS